jgi:hypothetical protein
MSQLHPYAGADSEREHVPPPEAVSSDDAIRLRGIVKHQAQALKIAGRVLSPF